MKGENMEEFLELREQGPALLEGEGAAGMLVLEADRLVSGTRVAGSFRCLRLSILEERFGGKSGRSAVEGTLLHALLQVLLCRPSPPVCCHFYTPTPRPLLRPT